MTIDWLVRDLIAVGGAIELFGATESRKSFLAMQFARAVATGTTFLGFDVPMRHRVLYVQYELTEQQIRFRSAPHANALADVYLPDDVQLGQLYNRARWQDMLDGIAQVQPGLLILDPLVTMVRNLNDGAQMAALLYTQLSTVCFQHGITVLVVHHPHKPPRDREGELIDEGVHAASGSDVVSWWAHTILQLRRHDKTRSTLLVKKCRDSYETSGIQLQLRWDDTAKVFIREADPAVRLKASMELIPPEGIAAAQWHRSVETTFGVARATTQEMFKRLLEHGDIEFTPGKGNTGTIHRKG